MQRGKYGACLRGVGWSDVERASRWDEALAAAGEGRDGRRAQAAQLCSCSCSSRPQARQQLGEVARPVPDVQLGREDLIPAVATCPGRARQGEQIRPFGNPGRGARLHGRAADLLKADHPEQLAEARNRLVDHRIQRLGCDVASGDAGAAGADHHVDARILDPLPELGSRSGLLRRVLRRDRPTDGPQRSVARPAGCPIGRRRARDCRIRSGSRC